MSLQIIAQEEWRRERLRSLIAQLRAGLAAAPWQLMASETPIQPLLVGGNDEALALSAKLAAAGLLVPAIRPPTVPQGTARLRISLSADHQTADVARLVETLMAAA
jgi:8-amino-7-oxononanoate synthase